MNLHLEDARAAVERSDQHGGRLWALEGEVRDLRDALRAIIQWAEEHDHDQPYPGLNFIQ